MTIPFHLPGPELSFRRTRIAPTPSGYLHLGNVFSFALTAALAGQSGAALLLRIDDLDRDRASETYIRDIFDTLSFLNIRWQEGPADPADFQAGFSQVHRLHLYHNALDRLARGGHVFACECSRATVLRSSPGGIYPGTCLHKNIPLHRPGVSWRLKTDGQPVSLRTPEGLQTLPFPPEQQYFVVRRSNTLPAYQLASVVDDLYFQVDCIVRGEDLLASTLAQLLLAQHLQEEDFLRTIFLHHPLLTDRHGRKLSKSDGDTSIQFLRKRGCTAEDIRRMAGI